MNRLFRLISIILLTCVVAGTFASCDAFDLSSKEPEQTQGTSPADEKGSDTTTETEEPNPLAKVVDLGLNRYKKTFSFYWEDDREGHKTGKQLTGVTRFLYRTQKATVYQEISLAMILADGTGVRIDEGNELTHLIVVFEKGHNLTDNEKSILKEYGIDYMFER